MKRIATATVVICLLAVLHVMGQTTSTSTPKSTSTATPATKPTASSTAKLTASPATNSTASSTAKPTASAATKPTASSTAKPSAKPVLYWDGTGRWHRLDGDAKAEKTGAERADKWPSPTYEQPASEPSEHALTATGESGATSRGSNRHVEMHGPGKATVHGRGGKRDIAPNGGEERRTPRPRLHQLPDFGVLRGGVILPASGWRTLHTRTTQVPERARCGTAEVRDL